jgi:hypothetical protein
LLLAVGKVVVVVVVVVTLLLDISAKSVSRVGLHCGPVENDDG